MTQEEDLDPKTSNQGAKLRITCIIAQICNTIDIALYTLLQFPELAIAILKEHPSGTLNTLATRNSTFPSGTQLLSSKPLILGKTTQTLNLIQIKWRK
ncbi:hypothetical protein CsSME_00042059 [Camellia sinensis var. sinensis]